MSVPYAKCPVILDISSRGKEMSALLHDFVDLKFYSLRDAIVTTFF